MSGFIGRAGALSKLKPLKSGCFLIDRRIIRRGVVPHFSSGIVERAKRERVRKSPHASEGDTPRVVFSRVG